MELTVHASNEQVEVAENIFGANFNQDLVHQLVTAYMSASRSPAAYGKSRSDVSGGGRKPWRQKGTGRARAGTIRSPLWRSGGRTFAGQARNYVQKVNRKQYRAGMRSILSELQRQDRLIIVQSFTVAEAKTKSAIAALKELGLSKALVVTAEVDEQLYLATRNLKDVEVLDAAAVNPVSLVAADKVVMTVHALKAIEGSLS